MEKVECSELNCTICIEILSSNGEVSKRKMHKNVNVVLGRDEFRDIILRIYASTEMSFVLRENITIHKKFVKEGKATIKLPSKNTQIFISNCPPDKLNLFLKCVSLKVTINRKQGFASGRQRLFSEKPRAFELVSPLTDKDVNIANQKSPLSATTPKIKRKREEIAQVGAARKRLSAVKSLDSLKTNLSGEQLEVLNTVRSGRNVFFTGSAGTGKSYLLKKILGSLPPEFTYATASTGAAACHIGGITLHSFAGIGAGSAPIKQCIEKASAPQRAAVWKKCRHLIIDEISMIDAEFFDKIEEVARAVKKSDSPFGGIQLIISGDFLQLPPVSGKGEMKKFCFEGSAWRECIQVIIELYEVRRQIDPSFIRILQNIRIGHCPEEVCEALTATRNNDIEANGIVATRLCTHKETVCSINQSHLSELTGKTRSYSSVDSDPASLRYINNYCPVGEKIELKVGAQVMLMKNLSLLKGLVNGARGVVMGFQPNEMAYPIIKFASGMKEVISPEKWIIKTPGGGLITRRQLPLQLAWAISIHKSQGMTLDCVEISLSRVFEFGQAYVALSRAKSIEGLRVLDFDKRCVKAQPSVLKFYAKLRREARMKKQMIPLGKKVKVNWG